MITRVQALRFRSLRYVDQRLGRFHAIVGPNGSGKSNFLDVIAFLGDLIRAGPAAAVLGEAGSRVPTRASDLRQLTWMGAGESFELAIELDIPEYLRAGAKFGFARYEVSLRTTPNQEQIMLDHETLWLLPLEASPQSERLPQLFPFPSEAPRSLQATSTRGWRKIVTKTRTGNDYFRSEKSEWNNQFTLGPNRSALSNLPADESRFPIAIWVRDTLLSGIQRLQLDADAMRLASPPGLSSGYLPDGSNLPWVIEKFKNSVGERRYNLWVEHVASAIDGLESIDSLIREDDRHRYLVARFKNGLTAPSWVLSDGTLRLIALSVLAYLPARDDILLIEEPENGIHPRAVETVMAALAQVHGSQVLIASHSPVVLSSLSPTEVLCFAKDSEGATDVIRGDNHPRLREWRDRPDLGTLLVAGVL